MKGMVTSYLLLPVRDPRSVPDKDAGVLSNPARDSWRVPDNIIARLVWVPRLLFTSHYKYLTIHCA